MRASIVPPNEIILTPCLSAYVCCFRLLDNEIVFLLSGSAHRFYLKWAEDFAKYSGFTMVLGPVKAENYNALLNAAEEEAAQLAYDYYDAV